MNEKRQGCFFCSTPVIMILVFILCVGALVDTYIDSSKSNSGYYDDYAFNDSSVEISSSPITASSLSYYRQLTDEQKRIYDIVYTSAIKGEENVKFTANTEGCKDNIWRAVQGMMYDHPEIFWFNGGYKYSYKSSGKDSSVYEISLEMKVYEYFSYKMSLDKYVNSLNESADKIVAEANKLSSEFEKARYVHDYLVNNAFYDNDTLEQANKAVHSPEADLIYTSYGCLVNGGTVCAGYAKAYQLVLNRLGIECAYVIGDAGGPHAWNCVKLDGNYYLTDVTWNDKDDKYKTVIYDYYNIPDSLMGKDHTPDIDLFTLPKCNELKANYYYGNYSDYFLKTYSLKEASRIINAQQANDIVTLKFESEEELNKAHKDLVEKRNVWKISSFGEVKKYEWIMDKNHLFLRMYKLEYK